jgi:hypothetical protein
VEKYKVVHRAQDLESDRFLLLQRLNRLGYLQPLPLNFPPYITFLPIFSSPAAVPPKYSPIPHYNYKILFSISTINFLSTNNYSWTHNTVFRVMNSDTLDLGGERRGPARRGRCRGHRCGCRVPPTRRMQGEGEGQRPPLQLALCVYVDFGWFLPPTNFIEAG